MPDQDKFEIHYRYAADKITVHLSVSGLDDLVKQLTRLKDEGVRLLGVSNSSGAFLDLTELEK